MANFPTNAQAKLAHAAYFSGQLDNDEVYTDLFKAGCYFSAYIQAIKSSVYYIRDQLFAEGRLVGGKKGTADWAAKCQQWQNKLGIDDASMWEAVRLVRDVDVHQSPVTVDEATSGHWPKGFWPQGYWPKGFWYEKTTTRFAAPDGKTYCVREASRSALKTGHLFLADYKSL